MTTLLALILLAPGGATKVPALVEHVKANETKAALALLKEIGTLEQNHDEAKALIKLIRDPRLNLPEEQPEIVEACFRALEGIKSRKVTRDLEGLLDHSRLKKLRIIRVGVCHALEGSADPRAVDLVDDLLRDPDDHVVAAAAETAGAYRYAKEPIRKELFQTIMDIYVGTWNLRNSVDPDLKTEKRRAERKWEIVEAAMEKSMQLLTNVTQEDPPSWRRWWNKNKHKRWAELEN